VRWLTGLNPTQAKLSLLDFTQSTDDIVDIVSEFPGLCELLPFSAGDPDFAEPSRWQQIKKDTWGQWKTAPSEALREAAQTWKLLRAAPADAALMRYVAGDQPATVMDFQLGDYEEQWLQGRKRLDFLATREGDGTVTWASGALADVSMYYAENTAHDALCAQPRSFPALLELLQTGTTTRLPTSPPGRARDALQPARPFLLPATPPLDDMPDEAGLRGLGFGGGLPPEDAADAAALPVIAVSVCHGDLSYARHPVLVGHYQGDTIISAEAVVDRQLNHALTQRLDLGLYPGRLDTHAVFFNTEPLGRPAGAVVVGLGQVGELTPGLLEAGVRSALLDYALQLARLPG
jgi:hypothetical protein